MIKQIHGSRYYARDDGTILRWSGKKWHRLNGSPDKDGYTVVVLMINRKKYRYRLHQLMLEMFIGPRPPGYMGCHRDGNNQNNHIDNLYWGTQSENERDKIRHGTAYNPSKKLTDEQVLQIRHWLSKGYSTVEVARSFGITPQYARMLAQGKSRA